MPNTGMETGKFTFPHAQKEMRNKYYSLEPARTMVVYGKELGKGEMGTIYSQLQDLSDTCLQSHLTFPNQS